MPDATFACPDLTTFARLDGLGLEAVGQRLEPGRAVLACRVVEPDDRCRRCGCEGAPRVEWHEGRVLTVEELERHFAYRGPDPVRVGLDVARDGSIDALVIGEAVLAGRNEWQTLKQLWHLTAQWGSPGSEHIAIAGHPARPDEDPAVVQRVCRVWVATGRSPGVCVEQRARRGGRGA